MNIFSNLVGRARIAFNLLLLASLVSMWAGTPENASVFLDREYAARVRAFLAFAKSTVQIAKIDLISHQLDVAVQQTNESLDSTSTAAKIAADAAERAADAAERAADATERATDATKQATDAADKIDSSPEAMPSQPGGRNTPSAVKVSEFPEHREPPGSHRQHNHNAAPESPDANQRQTESPTKTAVTESDMFDWDDFEERISDLSLLLDSLPEELAQIAVDDLLQVADRLAKTKIPSGRIQSGESLTVYQQRTAIVYELENQCKLLRPKGTAELSILTIRELANLRTRANRRDSTVAVPALGIEMPARDTVRAIAVSSIALLGYILSIATAMFAEAHTRKPTEGTDWVFLQNSSFGFPLGVAWLASPIPPVLWAMWNGILSIIWALPLSVALLVLISYIAFTLRRLRRVVYANDANNNSHNKIVAADVLPV